MYEQFLVSAVRLSIATAGAATIIYFFLWVAWWLLSRILNTFEVFKSFRMAFNLIVRKKQFLQSLGYKGKELEEKLLETIN